MLNTEIYNGGENFNLHQMLIKGKGLNLNNKTKLFDSVIDEISSNGENLCMRCISSPADREIEIIDSFTKSVRKLLMFGSNNYLGLANHPYIKEKVKKAIDTYGAGIGGPPLLNGYTILHKELEERLAAFKEAEDCLIFSSGYGANVGLVSALMNEDSIVLYDAYSHASFCDGITMSGTQSFRFPHNDLRCLEARLKNLRSLSSKDIYVGVEGVYSMDGDMAPLDKILELCKKYNAYLVIDDAHGTGVLGKKGRGSAEHFNIEGKVDITMGTFSKTFAVTGGFVAASKPIINYMRFFSRSYMFSASLPPSVVAAVLGSIDIIDREPEVLEALHENIKYTAHGLSTMGFPCNADTPIFPLIVPESMNIRKAAYEFHKQGIFVNSIEYPAVPVSQQRFRISIMSIHRKPDIDRLLSVIANVWHKFENSEQNLKKLTAA